MIQFDRLVAWRASLGLLVFTFLPGQQIEAQMCSKVFHSTETSGNSDKDEINSENVEEMFFPCEDGEFLRGKVWRTNDKS